MEATLTLHQAGSRLGVEDTVLSRLIRIGALPEARKVNKPDGDVWVIPSDELSAVATRNGWTIDLRHGEGRVVDGNPAESEQPTETTDPSNPSERAVDEGEVAPIDDGEAPAMLGALVPHVDATPAVADGNTDIEVGLAEQSDSSDDEPSTMIEALDLAVLDRLLGAQEGKLTAEAQATEAKNALAALNDNHNRATGELEIERRERMMTADRYREERMARAVADAKVAELRDRVVREMALADAEKEARSEALTRSIKAERDAANAIASMGWLARRRYRKINAVAD